MDGLLDLLSWRYVVATIIAYYVTLAFYRLYLHPLARFPGPRLAAISTWYEGYYDIYQGGQYTFKIAQLHKQYGMVYPSIHSQLSSALSAAPLLRSCFLERDRQNTPV